MLYRNIYCVLTQWRHYGLVTRRPDSAVKEISRLLAEQYARQSTKHSLPRYRVLNLNLLRPNDPYMGRTAPLSSKRFILYIYSTNIGNEYFKHALYSPFFLLKTQFFHNSNLFGSCIIHILYTGCAKIKKKNNSGAKGLMRVAQGDHCGFRSLHIP